jgi:hypothetical protein
VKNLLFVLAIATSFLSHAEKSIYPYENVDYGLQNRLSPSDYTYWKESRLDKDDFCTPDFFQYLVNDLGYSDQHHFNGSIENFWSLVLFADISHIYFDKYEANILHTNVFCSIPSPGSEMTGMLLTSLIKENAQYDHIVLEMEADATYFIGNGGPQIDIRSKLVPYDSDIKLQILYLSSTGWEVATEKVIAREREQPGQPGQPDITEKFLTTELPHPARVKFRILSQADSILDQGILLIQSVKIYTQECVPDQANPGLCL